MNNILNDIYVLTGQYIRKKHPAAIRRSLSDVFRLLGDASLADIPKTDRWFWSQSLQDIRPTRETSYATWSGVIVVDLDIKNAQAALEVKRRLHKLLSKQSWFVGTVLSTSHNGVHIYTACKPDTAIIDKAAYLDHAEAMSLCIWQALCIAYKMATAEQKLPSNVVLDMHPEFNISSRKELKSGVLSDAMMFDLSTFKLTQPTLIGFDTEPLLNDNFQLEPPLSFDTKNYDGLTECVKLKAMFDKMRGRNDGAEHTPIKVNNAEVPTLEQCMPRAYDNTARYRLAYTICNIYDITSSSHPNYHLLKQCFLRMCSGNPKYSREKHAFEAVFDSAVQRQAAGMCPHIAWAINELQTVHGFSIDVTGMNEVVQQVVDIDVNLELSKLVVTPPELVINYDAIYQLEDGQYIADGTDVLLSNLQKPGQKTLLIAEPGTGKTVFATNLMQHSKLRILCIVPYISVIESKFKTLPPEADCQCCYGLTSYDVTASRNAVMTFDKFSRMPMNDIDLCFDLVVLDESHLLQMSAYRSLVPAECIDRLRDCKTPTVLMTGTPIAEHMFVSFTNKIMFKRHRATSKLFSLVVCNNPAEKFAQAVLHMANAIRAGRKVIMPTNEGNSYVEKITAALQERLKRPVNWQYYKKEFADQAFMYEVNRRQTLGDIELLFCSSYLSVGVDINDLDKFDLVYTEDFTAHELEQFNNRLRNVDLASYYFIAKFGNDGFVKPTCMNTITPNLRVSKLRQMELADLLSIQTMDVDEDGRVSALFDYFQKHMRMPWLLRQPDGKVKLHATCYGLWTFEDTWRRWAVQVPILVDQLRKYNYQIEVINSELLDNDALSDILESARNGLHDYKDRVMADLQFIIERMQNKDFYDVMVYSNAIRLVNRKFQGIEVDNDKLHISVYVQNVAQCHRFIRSVRMLSKYYTRTTVLSLYDKVDGKLSKFEQVCATVELLDYAANDRLSTANVDAIRYVLYTMFDGKRSVHMSKKQYLTHLSKVVEIYKLLYDLQSAAIIDKVHMHADAMIKRLAMKCTNLRGDTTPNLWELKSIPEFDSSAKLNLDAQKALMYTMFKASMFDVNKDKATHDDVNDFFTHSKSIREADNVDLMNSLSKLESMQVEPTISNADRSKLMRYIVTCRPEFSTYQVIDIIRQIDLHSDTNYFVQVDKLLNVY